MSESQIKELTKNKKTNPLTAVYSNASGYITGIDIKEGDYVQKGGTVVRLADLSTVWVEAQVYSSQLALIDKGTEAMVQFPDMQGKEVKRKIEFINPEINPDTRINLIRISFPNPGNQLKPGMPAYVVIKNSIGKSLSLPTDAIIRDNRGLPYGYKPVDINLNIKWLRLVWKVMTG